MKKWCKEKKSEDIEFRFSAFFQHNFIKETKYNILVQFSCCFLMILSLLFDLSTYPPMYFTEYNFSTKLSEGTLAVCCYLLGYPIKLVKKLDAWCRCETSMSVWVRSLALTQFIITLSVTFHYQVVRCWPVRERERDPER